MTKQTLFQRLVARIGQRQQQVGKGLCTFIRAIADGDLTNLDQIEAGLTEHGMSAASLQHAVDALKQRRTLQGSIQRQPELQAALATLEAEHVAGQQAFDEAAKKWRADSERLREEQATIRLQLAAVHHHRSQLLSSTPTYAREELKPLDAALVELNHRRQHLAEMLSANTSNVYDRRFTPVRILESFWVQEARYKRTIGAVEKKKPHERNESDRRALTFAKDRLPKIEAERAAAEKELADVQRRIATVEKKQKQIRDELVLI